jgi:hypothetical protein
VGVYQVFHFVEAVDVATVYPLQSSPLSHPHVIATGNSNGAVTAAIKQVADMYDVRPISGTLMHQMKQYVIDGKKMILLKELEPDQQKVGAGGCRGGCACFLFCGLICVSVCQYTGCPVFACAVGSFAARSLHCS